MQTALTAVAGAILLVMAFPALKTPDDALDSLVGAERRFAALSVEKGMQEAFITNLAPDAILFRPVPVNGVSWMKDNPAPDNIVLSWRPIFADIASTGDMGYTTGPWELRKKGVDTAGRRGHYITVWKKYGEEWKAVIDAGAVTPDYGSDLKHVQTPPLPATGTPLPETVLKRERALLLSADSEIAALAPANGLVRTLERHAADSVRCYRSGIQPVLGRHALAEVEENTQFLRCDPVRADVAVSGDLGYTYGVARYRTSDAEGIDSTGYLRIWKKQAGIWKIVVSVE